MFAKILKTSEGAKKAWLSRQRGGAKEAQSSKPSMMPTKYDISGYKGKDLRPKNTQGERVLIGTVSYSTNFTRKGTTNKDLTLLGENGTLVQLPMFSKVAISSVISEDKRDTTHTFTGVDGKKIGTIKTKSSDTMHSFVEPQAWHPNRKY